VLHLLLPLRSTRDEFGRHTAASGYVVPWMLLPSLFRLICAATHLAAGMLHLLVAAFRFAGFIVLLRALSVAMLNPAPKTTLGLFA
jgi:hypothetical protein